MGAARGSAQSIEEIGEEMNRFKGPQGFGMWMNILMNVAMGIIITLAINISVCMQVGMNIITPEAFIASFVSSFVIGFTVGSIGGPDDVALRVARAINASRFVTWIIQAVILGTYFGMFILCGNMLINNLPQGLGAFASGFATWALFVEVSAIIAVFVIIKPVMALAAAISGFNPAKAGAQDQQH